jgi:integrase
LQKIYSLDLSQKPQLEKVRDLFIIAAWTGLRFGDFTSIKPEFIKGDFLHIEQHKTLGKVTIPVHPIVLEILNKYKGILPPEISNQKFNEDLKKIGQLAELTEPVYKTITKGGVRISTKYKKWELITSHSGRRSFASNLYKSGFPAKSIMKITGHKTEEAFYKYIKLTPDEHAKLLQQHWLQQGAFMKVAK